MSRLWFRAFDDNDPNGTPLGDLTDTSGKMIAVEYNGLGAGELLISRHSTTQAGWCKPDRYIKAYLSDPTVGSPDPTFGWWVTQSSDDVLSSDEDGSEVYRRQGPGALYYLSEAIVWHETVFGGPAVLTDGAHPRDGEFWYWNLNATPGGILVRMIEEAQARGCLPDLTYDFTRTLDSNGDPWQLDPVTDFRLPIGMDLLTVVGELQRLGLVVEMTPDLVLHAYDDIAARYTDLSSTITLEKGVDIASSAERQQYASGAKSTQLVKGTRGDDGELVFVPVDSASALSELGRRKEGYQDAGATTGFDALTAIGQDAIYRMLRRRAGPTGIGVVEQVGEVPLVDYVPGDFVNVDIPGVFNDVAKQVTSITLQETDNGECDIVVGFDEDEFQLPGPAALDGRLSKTVVNTDSACRYFAHTPDALAPPNMSMRMRDYGGDDFYSTIAAARGDADADALLTLLPGNANLQSFDSTGSEYAELNLDSANGGDVTFTLSETFTVEIDGTNADSKFYIVGGWGLVLPSGAGVPSGPNSEQGQVWYDETADEPKWYDGSTWNSFSTGTFTETLPVTIIDAKGDLIAGTAADTADNLAVGANGSALIADSAATTGLRWRLNNDAASTAPTVNDDTGDGYTVGSRWLDTTNDKEYVCADASSGAAVWVETTGGGGQFTDDVANFALRFPANYLLAATAGDGTTEDALLSAGVDIGGTASAALDAFDANGASAWSVRSRVASGFGEKVTLDVTDTDSDSKHKLTGGHGLVVPLLASDPAGGDSEEGQIYFNTATNKFRGHDGTSWTDLN